MIREYRDLIYARRSSSRSTSSSPSGRSASWRECRRASTPSFDPWAEAMPFAEELVGNELGATLRRAFGDAADVARLLVHLPGRADRLFDLAEGEGLRVQAVMSEDFNQVLRKIERGGRRLSWTVAAAVLFLGGLQLELARSDDPMVLWLWGGAGAAFLWSLVRR